jgi:hypothetical protein
LKEVSLFQIIYLLPIMDKSLNPIGNRLLIILGIETMVAGITGIGGTNLPCCYVSHIILMSISIFGIGVFALAVIAEVITHVHCSLDHCLAT